MRILYLHQYFATPKSNGGTRSYEFARRLIAKGHEVHFITSPGYLPDEYKDIQKTTTLDIDGIPVTVIPVAYGNQMSFAQRIVSFIKFALLASFHAMRHRCDVIYATSTPLTIMIPGLCAKLRWRKPMVFEVRDLWPEVPVAIGAIKNPVVIGVARAMEWLAYRSSRHVVALSEDMGKGVEKRGVDPSRITIIPNSCDTAIFEVPAERGQAVRERLGLAEDDRLVVYTGTLGIINHVVYLVEAAKTMQAISPRVKFLLIGAGNRREQTIERAQELGVLDENLFIWDPAPKTEIPNILAAASIATSTVMDNEALWPNSANKIFDAMASRTPIAINHGGWQARLIEAEGIGVVMPPDDPAEGARRLAEFLLDDARVAQASDNASALAHGRLSRDHLAVTLEQVLIDAAAPRHAKKADA